jgi:DNA ligase-1
MVGICIGKFKCRWLSEKLDGVRGFWNGKTMASRNAKEIRCPGWFTLELPKEKELDGELWLGRGTFEALNGVLQSNDLCNSTWKNISYMVFDLPKSCKTYEDRIRELLDLKLPNHVHVVNSRECKGRGHLEQCISEILEHGGEGIMANKPGSLYANIRTDSLLKVKVLRRSSSLIATARARL